MISIFWFRRDLRLEDNAGLYKALKGPNPVLPLFIFDAEILDDLQDKKDGRVTFIHDAITNLSQQLSKLGSSLIVRYGKPKQVWEELLKEYAINKVYTNRDTESYAISRDQQIKDLLKTNNIDLLTYKDHIIFEKGEVTKDDGLPYTVFTPFSRKWKAKLASRMTLDQDGKPISYYLKSYPTLKYADNFHNCDPLPIMGLHDIGFERSDLPFPKKSVARKIIKAYSEQRDYPAVNGTSKLGVHYRFGTISIREKANHAQHLNETYLNELIWRDFYSTILAYFPNVVGHPFRLKYDFIEWRDAEEDFEKWKEGKTGYPLVDAGMRELAETGYMHNRVRMVVASFLTKHLLIDWRKGEAWFAEKLLDFDLASNNGGWQWAAGCGTDAAPYFRIFNPESQLKKFDAKFVYVKKWVPEFATADYPEPMVDHKFARQRCLEVYKAGLAKAEQQNQNVSPKKK